MGTTTGQLLGFRKLTCWFAAALCAVATQAQLAYYEFSNSLVSGDTNPDSTASLVSLVGLGTLAYSSTSIGAPPRSLRLRANVVPSSLSLGSYLQFDVAANAGRRLDLSSLTFDLRPVGTSYAVNWQVRSSLDGYAAALGSGSAATSTSFTTATVNLAAAQYDRLTAITFRLYFSDNSALSTSSLYVDNLKLNGTTVIPEPHEWACLAAAGLLGFAIHHHHERHRAS